MIRYLALISTVTDHIGLLLFPQVSVLRIIGRIAFPVYLYMCVEGYKNTRDKKKYAFRMLIFSIICIYPSFVAFGNPVSIGVTYLLVMGECFGMELIRGENTCKKAAGAALIVLICLICFYLREKLPYSWYGLVIGVLYFLRDDKNPYLLYLGIIITTYLYILTRPECAMQMLALPVFIILPNMKKEWIYGRSRRFKYLFYLFYPLHILIIYMVKIVALSPISG